MLDRIIGACIYPWPERPGRVTPKIQRMVLDASLLNTQNYKVWIKGNVEQSRESGVVAIKKGAYRSPTLLTQDEN